MCKPTTANKRMIAAETFFRSSQASREVNHSVIRFDTAVNIDEIKILSPSQFVSTERGGLMFGTTEPSRFSMQLFLNNIHHSNIEEFVKISTITYDENNDTTFNFNNDIWSDKLIVRGKFNSLSIIVYGTPMDPYVEHVQNVDETTNLPLFQLPEGGIPNILTLADEFFLDPVLLNEISNMELDPNYY